MGKLGEETAALKTAIEREVQERKDEASALSTRDDIKCCLEIHAK